MRPGFRWSLFSVIVWELAAVEVLVTGNGNVGNTWTVGAGELVRHYAGLMAHEYVSVPADDTDVIGILAYSSLAFMTRLAKDGEQAPTFEAHVVHGLFDGIEDVWPFEQGHWVRAHLGPQIEADPQLADRLSLWGRRVAGEALGLVRATLFTYPQLAMTPDNVDEITEYVIKRHGERMKDIFLKA